MTFLEKYKEYFKNNPNGYWFKKKLYGWGWVPVKWQGWLVLAIYVALLVCSFVGIDAVQDSSSDTLINFAPRFVVLSLVLIWICYKKGEKPGWQWGIK